MKTWVIDVFVPANSKLPTNQGYIEKPTKEEALEAARSEFTKEFLSNAKIAVRPVSFAPNDRVLWLREA